MSENVADTVRRAAQRDPSAPALIVSGQSAGGAGERALSWGELDARVDAVAGALRAQDLDEGVPARVALVLSDALDLAVTFFGVLRAGLVAVPVNPGFTPRELRHVLADSGAGLVVAEGGPAEAVLAVRSDLPAVRSILTPAALAHGPAEPIPSKVEGSDGGSAGGSDGGPAEGSVGGEDLAVILYTSGTSGTPKGAMLPHRALLANQRQLAALTPPPVGPGDVVLLALPLFHIFGLNAGLICVAYHGACGVLLDGVRPTEALAAVRRHRVSVVGAVPQLYAAWLAESSLATDFEAVRVAVSGAAPLPATVAEQFLAQTGRPVRQGYGLTETAPVLTMGGPDLRQPTSIGRPLPGVSVRLVAADGSVVASVTSTGLMATAPDAPEDFVDDDAFEPEGTDPGQIVVRGENLFRGYWPDGHGGPGPDGWWATGDVAFANADGDLFLVDRLVDLILVSGFNVYPREVEQVLLTHPAVADAAVVGVPAQRTGEAVLAYVVPADGAVVDLDDLRRHCAANLARYKCPSVFEVVPELPHSAIGKVRKGALRSGRPA